MSAARFALLVSSLTGLLPSVAVATPQTIAIVDRNFDLDVSSGPAHGTPRTVSMGGSATALAEGALGMLSNIGAVARRPLSAAGRWDWDFAFDVFAPRGSDFENNGLAGERARISEVFDLALTGHYRQWGLGIGVSNVSYGYGEPGPAMPGVKLDAVTVRLGVARAFADGAISIGLGIRSAALELTDPGSQDSLFEVRGDAAEAGILYAPGWRSHRVGLRGALAVQSAAQVGSCDPMSCRGHILPGRAVAPWQLDGGWSWRLGDSEWNVPSEQGLSPGSFRDEKSITLTAELRVMGPLTHASGIEAFGDGLFQRSRDHVTLSPRTGVEWEWLPGRLRLRAGSYWEPSRFDGVTGRAHGTAGAELRLFVFRLFGQERRLALSVASDLARHYANGGLSFGFWH